MVDVNPNRRQRNADAPMSPPVKTARAYSTGQLAAVDNKCAEEPPFDLSIPSECLHESRCDDEEHAEEKSRLRSTVEALCQDRPGRSRRV